MVLGSASKPGFVSGLLTLTIGGFKGDCLLYLCLISVCVSVQDSDERANKIILAFDTDKLGWNNYGSFRPLTFTLG